MARPEPKVWLGRWVVDLRPLGFGQRYTLGPGDWPALEALHAAYALLDRLRRERLAEPAAQLEILPGAPTSFAGALDAWQATKRYSNEDSKRYGDTYSRLVRAELGAYALAEFTPPAGHDRIQAWCENLGATLSGRTVRNRLSIAMQVLTFAARRGWLAAVPAPPERMPGKKPPTFSWITEPTFRAVRDEIFSKGERCDRETYERRRLYLSWLFYTGCHTRDADTLTSDGLFLEGGSYIRHNNKSARVVPDEQFEMPEPLIDDLRALQSFLGREFRPGEQLGGGPWPKVAKLLGAAARRLELPGALNPRILRRSFAREMYQRGYSEQEVADRMGHVDLAMLHEIYVRTPRPAGAARSKWKRHTVKSGSGPRGNGLAKVVQLGARARVAELVQLVDAEEAS